MNQQLFGFPVFTPCFLNTNTLIEIAGMLDSVSLLQYHFEQLPSMFSSPVVMKGRLMGQMAHKICFEYAQQYEPYFYVETLSGQMKEESQGTISFSDTGLIKVDASRLTEFIKVADTLIKKLKNRYSFLLEKCLIRWQANPGNSLLCYTGNPIDVYLVSPIDRISGLIKLLTQGQGKLNLFGTAERVSRKLWSIKTTEWQTSEQMDFEISNKVIRIFLKRKNAIPLLDRVEQYIRRHINAELNMSSL